MTAQAPFRLAMRGEGSWWVAYLAKSYTMEDATEIGRIRIAVVENNNTRRSDFIRLMTDFVAEFIEEKFGVWPDWEERPAPESER